MAAIRYGSAWSIRGRPNPRRRMPARRWRSSRRQVKQPFKPMSLSSAPAAAAGVAAALLAEAGKRVIILEAGSYHNESDFEQSELAAYQKLFLRGGFFPSADGMVSIAAGSTVGGGSTVNWSNSLLTPNTRAPQMGHRLRPRGRRHTGVR